MLEMAIIANPNIHSESRLVPAFQTVKQGTPISVVWKNYAMLLSTWQAALLH